MPSWLAELCAESGEEFIIISINFAAARPPGELSCPFSSRVHEVISISPAEGASPVPLYIAAGERRFPIAGCDRSPGILCVRPRVEGVARGEEDRRRLVRYITFSGLSILNGKRKLGAVNKFFERRSTAKYQYNIKCGHARRCARRLVSRLYFCRVITRDCRVLVNPVIPACARTIFI